MGSKRDYWMNSLIIAILVCFVLNSCESRIEDLSDDSANNDVIDNEESADFNFDDKKTNNGKTISPELKQMYNWWTIEDICKDVKCKSNEYCVIKSREVAVCVKGRRDFNGNYFDDKQKKLKTLTNSWNDKSSVVSDDDDGDDDYDEDIDQKSTFTKEDESKLKLCTPCPVVKPQFICGSDNSTYSSLCRLDFHNCVHKTNVNFVCKGFCPCFKRRRLERKKNVITENKHSVNKLRQQKKAHIIDIYSKKSKLFPNKKAMLSKKVDNSKNMHNSVLPMKKTSSPKQQSKCTAEELKVMGTRLLDWFSVVITEQQKKDKTENKRNSAAKIPDCHKDVSWMFHHFDTNSDLRLSLKELYYLEHDESEHCLQPYLSQCDEDNDSFLSAYEWCTCFDTKSSPCTLALQHLKKGLLGAYSPQCDSDGFFKTTQCHASTGVCWCVDKNGVEFLNSRRKGVPDCKALLNHARQRTKLNHIDTDDDEDDDDDDNEDNSGDGAIE